jgi:hypothetical protein
MAEYLNLREAQERSTPLRFERRNAWATAAEADFFPDSRALNASSLPLFRASHLFCELGARLGGVLNSRSSIASLRYLVVFGLIVSHTQPFRSPRASAKTARSLRQLAKGLGLMRSNYPHRHTRCVE